MCLNEESNEELFTNRLSATRKMKVKRMGITVHTAYGRNNMGQKCEGNCVLWVLNEMNKEIYPENLKKILGAVWELPAK